MPKSLITYLLLTLVGCQSAGPTSEPAAAVSPARVAVYTLPSRVFDNVRAPARELLRDAAAAEWWPGAVHVGSGGRESEDGEVNQAGRRLTDELVASIRSALPETTVQVVRREVDEHTQEAWRGRLPGALEFLFGATSGCEYVAEPAVAGPGLAH